MILLDPLRWYSTHPTSPRAMRSPRLVGQRRWAHMVSDAGLEELHAMAQAIGLKREWFQDKAIPHYDVRPRQWEKARALGAEVVDGRELVRRAVRAADDLTVKRVASMISHWALQRELPQDPDALGAFLEAKCGERFPEGTLTLALMEANRWFRGATMTAATS